MRLFVYTSPGCGSFVISHLNQTEMLSSVKDTVGFSLY